MSSVPGKRAGLNGSSKVGSAPIPSAWTPSRTSSSTKPAKSDPHTQIPSAESEPSTGYSNLARFGAISQQHQQGISKKLEELRNTLGEDADSDEEENVPNRSEVFANILQQYGSQRGGTGDLGEIERILGNATSTSSWTCLICICSLKRSDALWNCQNCSAAFHLNCIQKWAKDGVIRSSSFLSDEFFPEKDRFWACPKCRHEFRTQDAPTRYFCFCGKVQDPPNDPWILPHSCGQICGKQLKSGCDHKCLLLCHPGPCPPCPAQCRIRCFCGKTETMVRCGTQPSSCGKSCQKLLLCGKHACTAPCHSGPCKPCTATQVMKCACGAESAAQPCGTPRWHCDRACNKNYPCGFHRCEKVCHSGDCGVCPRSLPRSCPCGKTKAVTDCAAEISPCYNTCGKPVCPDHFCLEMCHFGPCGPCMQSMKKTCPCGAKTRQMPCSKDFICESKCKNMRNCSRHSCSKRCCVGNCPPCDQICGRALNCKTHKCESLCHAGPCYPCTQMVDVSCGCGGTIISVPCGRQRTVKPPRCNLSCREPSVCNHSSRSPHVCHFGKCPPCTQKCNEELSCGHKCEAPCHSAVEVIIRSDVDRPAGPWEVKSVPGMEVRSYPCPPCEQIVSMPCYGRHDEYPMKCCDRCIRSCGRECGRVIECGNHTCTVPCHELDGDPDGSSVDPACEECSSLCTKPTPCGHPCIMACHDGPCPSCPEVIRVKCHCQSMVLKFSCGKLAGVSEEEKKDLFSCKIQCPVPLTCGHPCTKLCHIAAEPHSSPSDCKKKVPVKCPCGRIKMQQLCSKVNSGFKAQCDDECRAVQEAVLKEEKRKLQEATDKKAQEEKDLQEQYDRKMRGRKRRRDRRGSEEEDSSFLTVHWKKLASAAVVTLLCAMLMRSFQII